MSDNDTRLLAVCRDCDFVDATTVDERPIGDPEDDPAFRNYDETGHNTGSFEPGSELLNEQFEIVFGDGDCDELRDDLWELCTGEESDDDGEKLVTDGGLLTQDGNTPEEFEPAEEYEDYVALLVNGSKQTHIVDPATFRQSTPPADYEGYSANIGYAESLCGGDERLGRMLPMDSDGANLKEFVCGHCLNALEKLEVDDE